MKLKNKQVYVYWSISILAVATAGPPVDLHI